ncbi:hypothetical protein FQN55_005260 [Onygenales sp. PD_40]|nr:hypothetical protein FQN55_005260 [Onygenales sp. PD_40]KAK2802276.1 hypothetical protein FQN51_004565 [Onygenales sp. PD_10]
MNLSHLVTSYHTPPSSTSSHSSTSHKRQALHNETPALSVSNVYYDRNASNLAYARTHQPPLSPPVEDQPRFSLPSISSLLQGADNLPPIHISKKQRPNPLSQRGLDQTSQNHGSNHGFINKSRIILPPTPPLRPGSGLDRSKHSPSSSSPASAHSPISVANLTNASITPTTETSHHRQISQAHRLIRIPGRASRKPARFLSPAISSPYFHIFYSAGSSTLFLSATAPTPPSFDDFHLAAPSLFSAVEHGPLPTEPGQVRLYDLSQGIFSPIELADSLTQPYGRETIQVPAYQLWQVI